MTDLERLDEYCRKFDAAITRMMRERGITDPGLLTEADVERARGEAE